MKNLTTLQLIASQISNFDFYYEFSDDNKKYSKGTEIEKAIKSSLDALSIEDLKQIKSMLTVSMELVNQYFEKYFSFPKQSSKSKLFKAAWYYFSKKIYQTFSECLKAAWRAFKLVKALRSGIVNFTYRKGNGEIREAVGTLNPNQLSSKETYTKYAPDAIKYFDLTKNAWRCFRIERLLN